MGQAGRDFVIANFRMETVANSYLKVYALSPPPVDRSASSPTSDEVRRLGEGFTRALGFSAQSSIVDRRFHEPLSIAWPEKPLLVTLIDAEEEFDWTEPFSRANVGVSSMARQQMAHTVFDRHGIKPTYLADFPVVSQDIGISSLLDLLKDGKCEVGAQLHPWVTPPFVEPISTYNSFLSNLSLPVQYAKIKRLKSEIEDRLGLSPTVFRAGRYGIGDRTSEALIDLGFRIDTSVVPRWTFVGEGGPDFRRFEPAPFWVNAEQTLLELPQTCDFVGVPGLRRHGSAIVSSWSERFRVPGILARTRQFERIKLSPEGITLEEAKRLTRTMLADGRRIFVLSYHSPSLTPGNTPYVRSQDDVRRLLDWLDGFYDFFINEVGGAPIACEAFRSLVEKRRQIGRSGAGSSPGQSAGADGAEPRIPGAAV